MNEQAAVAIINHNTRDLLRACLASVAPEPPAAIVVVDNASTDGSAGMVRAEFPSVSLLANDHNPGYGAAANQALGASRSPHVFVINSDTFVHSGTLSALSNYLDRHAEVAVVGPRLSNADGTLQPSCFHFPSPLDVWLDLTNAGRWVAQRAPAVRERYLRTWSHDRPRRVPWVSGAALMLRRSAVEPAGGFDPSFFMYYEEVDLCYRLARAGWQTHFAPVDGVVHFGGASTGLRRADMAVQLYAGLVRFYQRHHSRAGLLAMIGMLECASLARWARDAARLCATRDGQERAVLAANVDAWRRLLRGHWRRQVAP